jgi:endonuclease G
MAPSVDMPDAASQAESFTLANMVPQAPRLNRGVWEGIETAVRDLTTTNGDVYVVTGPIFQGSQLKALKGRVLVPSDAFKAIYEPGKNLAGAYVCTNTAEAICREVSIDELTALSGIDVFPGVPAEVKSMPMALPDATRSSSHRRPRK